MFTFWLFFVVLSFYYVDEHVEWDFASKTMDQLALGFMIVMVISLAASTVWDMIHVDQGGEEQMGTFECSVCGNWRTYQVLHSVINMDGHTYAHCTHPHCVGRASAREKRMINR